MEREGQLPKTRRGDSCRCRKSHHIPVRSNTPVVMVLLIALLPKCPFCVFAYSSAIVMCSSSQSEALSARPLPFVMALLVMIFILLNFRGNRTWIASGMAGLGSIAILLATFSTIPITAVFYLGAFLLFVGIWINGSLSYFIRKLRPQQHHDHHSPKIVTELPSESI